MRFLPCIKANLDCEKAQDQEVNSRPDILRGECRISREEINQPTYWAISLSWAGGLVGFPRKLIPGGWGHSPLGVSLGLTAWGNGNKASLSGAWEISRRWKCRVLITAEGSCHSHSSLSCIPDSGGRGREVIWGLSVGLRYLTLWYPTPKSSWIQHCFSLCKREDSSRAPLGNNGLKVYKYLQVHLPSAKVASLQEYI